MSNIGKVTQVMGAVVDVAFEDGILAVFFNSLEISSLSTPLKSKPALSPASPCLLYTSDAADE